MKYFVWIMIFLLYIQIPVQASETEKINRSLTENLPSEAKALASDFFSDQAFRDREEGKYSFLPAKFFANLTGVFTKEFSHSLWYLLQFILVAFLMGFLGTLADSFSDKVGMQVGFYAGYTVLTALAVKAVMVPVGYITTVIDSLVVMMQGMVPAFIGLMLTSGNVAASSFFQPTILFAIEILAVGIKNLMLPLIVCMVALTAVNFLDEKNQLGSLLSFIASTIKNVLITALTVFTAILGVQGFAAVAIDGVMGKTAKFAVDKFVPVVGGILSGAADTVMGCSLIIRNAVGVGGIVAIVLLGLIPVIKLFCMLMMFRLSSAITAPVCDSRLNGLINGFGNILGTMMSILLSVLFLCFISISMLLASTNFTMMFR